MSINLSGRAWHRAFCHSVGTPAAMFIIALFLGIAAGAGVGAFSSLGADGARLSSYAAEHLQPTSFARCLVNASELFLLSALFSTSYLGVVLLPSLVFVRGCILSFGISAMFTSYSLKGLLCALLVLGIPAFVSIPCLLIVCTYCFHASKCLFMQRFNALPTVRSVGSFLHILIAVFAVAFDCIYTCWLLPAVLSRFF